MSVRIRFEPVELRRIVDVSGLSPEKAGELIGAAAREIIGQAKADNERLIGRSVDMETFVDGTPSERFENVRPNGRIVATFDTGLTAVEWIYHQIVANSPVLTGAFQRSHVIFADDREIAAPGEAIGAEEVVITTGAPYARKIERGQSPKAPKGVYEAVAALAAQRFGNMARIRYTMRIPTGPAAAQLEKWAAGNAQRRSSEARRRGQMAKNMRQPAIVISFR